MSLVTVQRSPSPSNSPDSDDGVEGELSEDLDDSSLKSPGRQRRSESAKKKLKKFFNTIRFISKLQPSFSESYFAVKGAVLILPQSDVTDHTYTQKIVRERHAGVGTVTGDIQSHLQSMFYLLRSHDTIKVAVKLESLHEGHNRYMAVVSCFGKQDTEESVILGIDCNKEATIGLVLPIWADTSVKLNGDGGFMVSSEGKQHIFKPVSVQAMWSALQSLNKVVKISRDKMYIPRGLTHTWVGYYNSRITSERACISEWYTSEELQDWRSCNVLFMDPGDSPDDVLQKKIKTELKNIMMTVDLDEVTSRFIREALEEKLNMKLKDHKQFVEQEMITIMGLMDSPTMIKDFLYLGSEFNASNLEELTENGVDHILNISREVDNFFPEILTYMNIKEWDNEEADLCKHWDNTNKFIAKARRENSKVLVHCKMGISRSASTVMAFLMKEYGMSRQEAYDFVKAKRACVMPNQAFWAQLLIYEGILNANKQRALFKSKSEQNLMPAIPAVEKEEEEEILIKGHRLVKDDLCLPLLPPYDDLHDSVFLQEKNKDIMFDLESSSRSADSTEESVDLPSPKADAVVKSTGYGVYVIESNKLSPGDGPDTDTSSLSEEDQDFGETDTDNLYKNESERNQSQLAAATKFKPDHSWIKAQSETIDESDAGVKCLENQEMPISESVWDDDVEGTESAEQTLETKPPMEAEDTNSSEIPPDTKPPVADDITETTEESPSGVELGVRCHYIKENIPWNPGTVKKQLQDFEGKTKQEDTESGNDDEEVNVDPVATDVKGSEDAEEEVTDAPMDSTEQDKGESEGEDKPPLKRSASVYEIEDITLPAGIVKKTTQEIEDRNFQSDSSPESPHKPLQRSSSLKEERVTPKRKRSERRKTCTPIITPSPSPTATPGSTPRSSHDTTPSTEHREFVFPSEKETKSSVEGQTTMTDQSITTEESPEEDVAVYKFGTEEVPVAKGIVKKQKMDIEQKARDRQTSESRTPDSDKDAESMILLSQADVTKDFSGAFKCKSTVPTSIDIPKMADAGCGGQVHSGKEDTQNFVKAGTAQLSTSPVSSRGSVSPSSPLVRKKQKTSVDLDDSGRFDSETLELIREIGSAFLNSPAKTVKEKEISEQEAVEGGSLVKFLVRNIEKTTNVTKKSHLKEIVIIDKETALAQQEKKKKLWRYSSPAAEPSTPPGDRPRVTHSHSSPALDVPTKHKDGAVPPGGALTPSSPPKVDPTPFLKAADPTNTQSAPSVIEPKETLDDDAEGTVKEKVKDLVGKFEPPDTVKAPTIKGVTPTEETLTIVLKENDNSKSTNTKSPVPTESDKSEGLPCACASEAVVTSSEGEDLEGEQSMSEQSLQLRHLRQNLRKANDRPKSAEHLGRSYSTTTEGATPQRPRLRHANTLPSPVELGPSTFSWEGKKVRKLHGKSHPLTKLETRRASPFYNTM